jgi:hypothetical protein
MYIIYKRIFSFYQYWFYHLCKIETWVMHATHIIFTKLSSYIDIERADTDTTSIQTTIST